MKQRTQQTTLLDSETITHLSIQGLQAKKAQNIVQLDLRGVDSAITDFFVICTGTSDRHVQALAESVMEVLEEEGEKPINKEGLQKGEWVLLDYVTVVIHIFQEEKRAFFRLEDLWGDAERIPIEVS